MRKGFSLIELLAVMAIISILSAIATVAYMKYITNSKYSKITTSLETAKAFEEKYYSDYNTYFNNTCDALNSNGRVYCQIPDGKLLVPPGIKIIFKTINCPDGSPGYAIKVETRLLRNSSGTGNGYIIYKSCYRSGNLTLSGITCEDTTLHRITKDCTF